MSYTYIAVGICMAAGARVTCMGGTFLEGHYAMSRATRKCVCAHAQALSLLTLLKRLVVKAIWTSIGI